MVEVVLLTEERCTFCGEAKEVLDRLRAEYPLSVKLEDLGSPHGQDLAISGGILFPPGVFLDGEPFSYGRLSERRLRRELQRLLEGDEDGQGR